MAHIPVLLQEVLEYLDPKPGKKYIDATIGAGGHAKEIIRRGGNVLGIDQDKTVILNLIQDPNSGFRLARLPARQGGRNENIVIQGNFAELERIAEEQRFTEVAGILFDLGFSSDQLDDPERGFAFQKEGPLDMRFAQNLGKTAAEIVNFYPEKDIIRIFFQYGEERHFGRKIAHAILERRKLGSIETTTELFELIKKALPGKFRYKSGDVARRIFQSLRIAVNHELENLEKALPQALKLLDKAGRLVVISFHSLEDRIVKKFFVQNAKNCVCPPQFPVCRCGANPNLRILTKKPIRASEEEIKKNSRASSAKLRAAEKLWEGTSL